MEKSVITAQQQLITLAAPGPVTPDQVESALAGLWREAVGGAEDGGGKVTRACLWNLVVYNPVAPEDFEDAMGHGYGLRNLLDTVIPSLPARIIRLERNPRGLAENPGLEALAHVAAKCVPRLTGERQIYGEEVNLCVYGKKGDSHFPSLVRALLHPNLPIGLLWLSAPPQGGWLLEQLVALCHRILVDSQYGGSEAELTTARKLVREAPELVVDIAWMRLAPIRHLVAGLFDNAEDNLGALETISVTATPAGRNAALLLLGWIAERCGVTRFKGRAAGNGVSPLCWSAEQGGKSVKAEIVLSTGETGTDGLLGLQITAGGENFSIQRVDVGHARLEAPSRVESRYSLHVYSEPELVIAGLGAHGYDPLYPEVLEVAAALGSTAQGQSTPGKPPSGKRAVKGRGK